MDFYKTYQSDFEKYFKSRFNITEPVNLYKPVDYILSNSGKRIRPILAMLACDLFGSETSKALPAALAVEVFHNFTLVHDDIMDDAALRRGKPSVHVEYDVNSAILSGDAMMLLAYHYLSEIKDPGHRLSTIQILTETGILLCEGQQLDVDFEQRKDVAIEDYLEMIEKKTSVLLGAALSMGAVIGGAGMQDQQHIYNFGKYIGLAFQIHDDILDVYGNQEKVGKMECGDIINNKKTYLFLKALELANSPQKTELLKWYDIQPSNPVEKIRSVKKIFNELVVKEYAYQLMDAYIHLGKSHLEAINIPKTKKYKLQDIADFLITRES